MSLRDVLYNAQAPLPTTFQISVSVVRPGPQYELREGGNPDNVEDWLPLTSSEEGQFRFYAVLTTLDSSGAPDKRKAVASPAFRVGCPDEMRHAHEAMRDMLQHCLDLAMLNRDRLPQYEVTPEGALKLVAGYDGEGVLP